MLDRAQYADLRVEQGNTEAEGAALAINAVEDQLTTVTLDNVVDEVQT